MGNYRSKRAAAEKRERRRKEGEIAMAELKHWVVPVT